MVFQNLQEAYYGKTYVEERNNKNIKNMNSQKPKQFNENKYNDKKATTTKPIESKQYENTISILNNKVSMLEKKNDSLTAINNELNEENQFLTDTIVNHNLGKAVEERKKMFAEITEVRGQAAKSIEEANKIKQEFLMKSQEIQDILDDINYKQSDVDKYINDRSDLLINDLKKELIKQNTQELEQQKKENDELLKEKMKQFDDNQKKLKRILFVVCPLSMIEFILLGISFFFI